MAPINEQIKLVSVMSLTLYRMDECDALHAGMNVVQCYAITNVPSVLFCVRLPSSLSLSTLLLTKLNGQ